MLCDKFTLRVSDAGYTIYFSEAGKGNLKKANLAFTESLNANEDTFIQLPLSSEQETPIQS